MSIAADTWEDFIVLLAPIWGTRPMTIKKVRGIWYGVAL